MRPVAWLSAAALLVSAGAAAALPPPLPIAFTVLKARPQAEAEVQQLHRLIVALGDDGWIAPVRPQQPYSTFESCIRARGAPAGCVAARLMDEPGTTPHVVLLPSPAQAGQTALECIGKGELRGFAMVDLTVALSDDVAARHPERLKVVDCILKARGG